MIKMLITKWAETGKLLISQNYSSFQYLIKQSQHFLDLEEYELSSVYSIIAANYAYARHTGLFVSPKLERILVSIGKKAITTVSNPIPIKQSNPRRIIHVATTVSDVGGLTRMIWRWIQQDKTRTHSLVLTRYYGEIPALLREAIKNSHGNIYFLSDTVGGIISWCQRLREIATAADLIVLHIHSFDIIPIIAFGNPEACPPIVFLNHADHLFWIGTEISNVITNLRESGWELSQERRRIPHKHNLLLPIILDPTERKLSRQEAKIKLGIAKDAVLLLSIARPLKYQTIDEINFANDHVAILMKYPQAILIVVGANNQKEWLTAIENTKGRIKVFSQTDQTATFYQAADIYVDTFPFVSITSLLEAGSYEVPLVSRYPYSSDSCKIFGADAPGLRDNLIVVRNPTEYISILSHLIEDEDYRLSIGRATKQKIEDTHLGDNWQQDLENIYACASNLPRIRLTSNFEDDNMFMGEPDVFIPIVYGQEVDITINQLIQNYLPFMPFPQRFYQWVQLLKEYNLIKNPVSLLLPEWLRARILRILNPLVHR